jgi:uncharacterized DUF497 family protein
MAVTFAWEATKAASNLRKHGISFHEAATVFLDPLAITFPDPDHSATEKREITIGHTMKQRLVFVAIVSVALAFGSSVPVWRRRRSGDNMMKKVSSRVSVDDLRKEYDLSSLKSGVRGKYYRKAMEGTNLVLLDPDTAEVFPDSESVNRALRMLAETARAAAPVRRRSKS